MNQTREDDAVIRITAEHNNGPVNIVVREWNATGDGRVVARFENLPFEDFVIEKTFNGPNPFTRASSGGYTIGDYIIAYHIRLASDENTAESLQYLFSTLDLRDRVFDYDGTFTDAEGNTVAMSTILDSAYWNPSLAIQDRDNLFSTLDIFQSETSRIHGPNNNAIIAYDLPNRNAATPASTLGTLRMLPVAERPAFSLGAPWGDEINAVFDDYYFAPDTTSIGLGLNHWMRHAHANVAAAPLGSSSYRPEETLAEGAFNINAVSPAAWSAILASPLRQPGTPEVVSGYLHAPFYMATADKALPASWTHESASELHYRDAYNIGGRQLSTDQFRALGETVAGLVQRRGRPFASVADFLNAGIIQRAIDIAHDPVALASEGLGSERVTPATIPINPPGLLPFSHGYLTQGDIVARLGHLFTTRSDTFTIRVYGEARHPLTGRPEAQAHLEAVVQRYPDKVDGTDPLTLAPDDTQGRAFRVVSLRWLTNDEI